MLPDPDPAPPTDPIDREYFSENWQNLPWTPWVSFTATKEEFHQIPKEPGLYRIRPVGEDFLMYIGETRRTLHQRLSDIRMELRNKNLMPWTDPHVEAPVLWAWQDAEAFTYECSAAPLDASINSRHGMESYLLYRYRQERGESTLGNFGLFHPRYRKSTTRKENLRGGKLETGQMANPAGSLSHPPLTATGTPGQPGWMGLLWSGYEKLDPEKTITAPAGPGLYLLSDSGSQEIFSIGQSGNCASRLLDHAKKLWDGKEPLYSFHSIEKTVLPHHLREMENDLIGNYFEQFGKAPEYQFRNKR
jgi:hypothetical protein